MAILVPRTRSERVRCDVPACGCRPDNYLDQLVCANEVEVLAASGFPPLGASDAEHLDEAALAGDVIAGSNVAGEDHLGP